MSLPATLNNNEIMASLGLSKITMGAKQAEESTGIKPSSWLPYITLQQKLTKDVETFKAGTFVLRKGGKDTSPIGLGDNFEAVIIAVRGKATFFDGKTVKAAYHTAADATPSPEYIEMRDLAKADPTNQSRKAGLDVLLYVPSAQAFAIYFANSATAVSQVETEFCPLAELTAAAKIFSDFKQNARGGWFMPKATEIENAEFGVADMPQELFKEAVKQFVFPVKSVEQEVDGAEKAENVSNR